MKKAVANKDQPAKKIAAYSKTEAALAELNARYAGVVFDPTPAGLKAAKEARATIRGYRTGIESTRKQIKAPVLEQCRLIDAEAERITAELEKLEKPIDEQIKAEEARKEAEREAAAEAERVRVSLIRDKIAGITGWPSVIVSQPSESIASAIAEMTAITITLEEYAEFSGEALAARAAALRSMNELHAAAVAREAEAARIQQEREELERLRDEAAERERQQEEERKAAEEKTKADKAAADAALQAERDAMQAQLQAEREAIALQQAEIDRQKEQIAIANAVPVQPAEPEPVVELVVEPVIEQIADPVVEPEQQSDFTFNKIKEADFTAAEAIEPIRPTPAYLVSIVAKALDVSSKTARYWLATADFSEPTA